MDFKKLTATDIDNLSKFISDPLYLNTKISEGVFSGMTQLISLLC